MGGLQQPSTQGLEAMPPPPPPARATPGGVLVVGLTAAASAGMIVTPGRAPTIVPLMLLAAAAAGVVVLLSGRAHATLRPSAPLIVAATAAVLVVAVVVPPRGSRDVYAYGAYGRLVAEHGVSPYRHAPAGFPNDPHVQQMRPQATGERALHGPAFIGLAAVVAWVAGDSPETARVVFQLIAALAVLAAMLLLARKTRDAAPLVVLGLHPVTGVTVVNGGHNDALVGLAVLGGGLLSRAHPVWAGLVLGLGASVKPVALIPLIAVFGWTWAASGHVHAAKLLGTGLGVVGAGIIAGGGASVLSPLWDATGLVSAHSFWRLGNNGSWVLPSAVATVAAVTLMQILARREAGHGDHVAGASLIGYVIAAPYVVPWYAWWALPALARWWRRPVAWLVIGHAFLLMAVYPVRRPDSTAIVDRVLGWFAEGVGPALEIAVAVFLLVSASAVVLRLRTAQRRAGMTSDA